MSAVTASIIVGTKHRSDPGIQPRWLLLLHEGQNYAWHLLKLQLTNGDLPSTRPEDPPGVLWQASRSRDLVGEMALLVHLFAARTPEIVRLAARTPALRKQRVDLAALDQRESEQIEALLTLARERGRELTMAATLLPGSRLTKEALLELPDWELNIADTGLTRDWHSNAQSLVVTDLRPPVVDEPAGHAPTDADEHDADESWQGSAEGFWGHGWAGKGLGHDPDAAHEGDGLHAAARRQGEASRDVAAGQDAEPERALAGRFRRRRHRPLVDTGDRHLSLAEFFGRKE